MLGFAFFVVFIVLLLWLFQIVLLDPFYRMNKTHQVNRAADVLVQNLDLASEDLTALSSHLSEQYDVCVLLLDADLSTLLRTEASRNCLVHHFSERTLAWWVSQAPSDGSPITQLFRMNTIAFEPGNAQMEMIAPSATNTETAPASPSPVPSHAINTAQHSTPDSTDDPMAAWPRKKDSRLRYHYQGNEILMDDQDVLVQSLLYVRRVTFEDGRQGTLFLNTQINPISSTIAALREQLLTITLIVLFTALLVAALISRHISNPIIKTNEAAKALSHAQYVRPKESDTYREIAELNDTLEKAAVELGQVDALQQELIANISHDLRTPLTMIGGYAEVMRDIPNENTPENMQIIIDETERLSTLVNELLDFSRLQSGAEPLKPEVFCLTSSVRTIVQRIGKLVEKDHYQVLFQPDAEYEVYADENRIARVVYNLIGNALTYTGSNRTVTVTQSLHEHMVRIDIHDSGSGIAKDELELIWNRYYRTKETHKRAVIGSGLGLSIVRTILEQHQVPFGVSSEESSGTTFWFELPLASHDTDVV